MESQYREMELQQREKAVTEEREKERTYRRIKEKGKRVRSRLEKPVTH